MPGITFGKSGDCRSTSIRSTASCRIRKIARGWRRCSSRAWTKSSATRCRCGADYYTDDTSAWASGAWFFRPERMYLIPGDSPMGYRLPLDSIPWVKESECPYLYEQDPMEDRGAVARPRRAVADRCGLPGGRRRGARRDSWSRFSKRDPAGAAPRRSARASARICRRLQGESAPWIIRTALCTEVRGGVLRVFMPPQRYLEDYLELVAAVEDTAAILACRCLLEGYTPPHDPRVNTIRVTPDPGVIEVNMHPAASWDELVKNTTALYEEARLTPAGNGKIHAGRPAYRHRRRKSHRRRADATPADSPLLRNPGLLRSLIGYWHNHPSLSYLFSGLFVGPTSQAPRVDEARNDQVYELEIAFRQIPERARLPAVAGGPHLPQSADRRDRQHAPRGVLHRQAVHAGIGGRAAGAARNAGVRNAAALAHEPHAASCCCAR